MHRGSSRPTPGQMKDLNPPGACSHTMSQRGEGKSVSRSALSGSRWQNVLTNIAVGEGQFSI